ncbi:MAG TPA: CHAT domain-containing tetratricopeptide repeat protein [Pyrinomonadaceae bacterium]|nr:CHAT domain-containing tetratricopeptide repeat protein [Pyrinomonadaceae bacterium]
MLRSEWRETSLHNAIAKYREVQDRAQALGDYELAAEMAKHAGDVQFLLSEYKSALEQYSSARSFWKRVRNRSGEMRAVNLIGYVHIYSGQSKKGLHLALQALNYHRQNRRAGSAEALSMEAEAENCAGEANYSLGKLNPSIEHFQRALDLWTAANDKSGQALASRNLAYGYGDKGEVQKAQALFDQSLSLYLADGDKRGEALALTAIGSANSFAGKKQAALDKHSKARELLRVIGDRVGEGIALNSIGKAYEDLSDLPTALNNYKQALEIYQRQGNTEFASATKYYIGRTYNRMGEKQLALQFFDESVKDSKLVGQRRVTAYALSAISAIQSEAGKKAEARAQLQQAVRLYQTIGDRRGQASALNQLAGIHHSLEQNSTARAYHERALNLFRAADDKQGEAATLYELAVVEGKLGNLANALDYVKKSNEVIEALRAQIVSPHLRASYYASVRKHAELYIDLLMRLGQANGDKSGPASAFEISEHAHARSLLEILGEASAQIRQGVDSTLLEQEQVLQQKLSALAIQKMRLLADRATPAELEVVAGEIQALTTSYRELETRIKQQSPRYANLVQPQPLSLARIQAELSDDTILLEYTLGAERSYLWAITKNSLTAYPLKARDEIEHLVTSVCKLLIARQTMNESDPNIYGDQVAKADAEYWQQAGRLSDMLLGPVADAIKGRTIIVVADGAIHYLPFAALPAPGTAIPQGSAEAIPLIVEHEIVSLPSASILATIRQTSRPGFNEDKLIAIVADPVFSADDPRVSKSAPVPSPPLSRFSESIPLSRLPATKDEAQSIMAIVPSGASMVAMGFDADRKLALSNELGQYRIVHLATHGVVDVESPEMSGIVLSMVDHDGNAKPGLMQLHDIYNMNLSNSELVVLSACDTALGKEVRGEGLVGLSRGFIYAGASSVVATLWKVDDSATRQLMTQFYKGLFEEGLTTSAALRKAKLSMWQQPRYRAPFYWAAFQLQGEYQERIATAIPERTRFVERKLLLILPISIGVLSLIFLIVMRRRRRRRA